MIAGLAVMAWCVHGIVTMTSAGQRCGGIGLTVVASGVQVDSWTGWTVLDTLVVVEFGSRGLRLGRDSDQVRDDVEALGLRATCSLSQKYGPGQIVRVPVEVRAH